jgi:hypothetical protein
MQMLGQYASGEAYLYWVKHGELERLLSVEAANNQRWS